MSHYRSAEDLLALVSATLGSRLLSSSTAGGDLVVSVPAKDIVSVLTDLRDSTELQLDLLTHMTVVDWQPREPRFELVYELYSVPRHDRLRVKAELADTGSEQQLPVIDSACPVYLAANWHEREAYDLFGIEFRGHPDLRRILLPENWDGHPLRRDYPYDGKPAWKLGTSVAEPEAKFDILES